jgi:hypothetical protein
VRLFGCWVGVASGVTLPQPSAGRCPHQLPPPAFGREVPPRRCPHDCVPGPGTLCAIAGGTWATQSAGTPLHRPLRPGSAPCGAWFPGVQTTGCGAFGFTVSATARRSRAHAAGRGRAEVSPQGTSACTPGKWAVDPHVRAPRRSPHSGPDPPTTTWRGGTHDNPAGPALVGAPPGGTSRPKAGGGSWGRNRHPRQTERNRAGPAGQAQRATTAEGAEPAPGAPGAVPACPARATVRGPARGR